MKSTKEPLNKNASKKSNAKAKNKASKNTTAKVLNQNVATLSKALTEEHQTKINGSMNSFSKDLSGLLDKYGLDDLQVHSFRFSKRKGNGECKCPDTGLPGVWVCNIETGDCECQC